MFSVVYLAALFFVLTPGILLTLPKGGSKMLVAATHAVVFAAVWYFTRRFVLEKFQDEEYKEEFQAWGTGYCVIPMFSNRPECRAAAAAAAAAEQAATNRARLNNMAGRQTESGRRW
jgi:hypothetical protein